MKTMKLILSAILLMASMCVQAQMFRVYKDGKIVYAVSNPDSIVGVPPCDPLETVDLGLPSGTLWAVCNIGAQLPEDIGELYQWGALTPMDRAKDCFNDQSSYLFYKPGCDSYTKYNEEDRKTILDQEDDVAHVLYGGNWAIPSIEQNEELHKFTTMTEETLNEVPIVRFTASNGNSIVFPKSGIAWYNFGVWSVPDYGINASFWLNSIASTRNGRIDYDFGASGGIKPIEIDGVVWYYRYALSHRDFKQLENAWRACGSPVRPVLNSAKK